MVTEICAACGVTLEFTNIYKNVGWLLLDDVDRSLQVRSVSPGLWEPWGTERLEETWKDVGRVHASYCGWIEDALTPERMGALRERYTRDSGLPA